MTLQTALINDYQCVYVDWTNHCSPKVCLHVLRGSHWTAKWREERAGHFLFMIFSS